MSYRLSSPRRLYGVHFAVAAKRVVRDSPSLVAVEQIILLLVVVAVTASFADWFQRNQRGSVSVRCAVT